MKRFLATMGIVGLTFLGATAPAKATSEQITICHATGSETHPYEEITINTSGLSAHENHQWGEDIIPAPAAGCPTGNTPPTPPPGHDGKKVTICHATGSTTNPYVIITIDESALPAHRDHQEGEDIIPAPAAGCPTGITPPTTPPSGHDGKKVTICHATGSTTNPYVIITIDESALPAHRDHQEGEDIIPAPAAGCPAGVPPVVPPKVVPPVVPPGVPPAGAAAAPPAAGAAGAAKGSVAAMNPGFNAQTAVAGEAETGIPVWFAGAALLLTAAGILALRRRETATANQTAAE